MPYGAFHSGWVGVWAQALLFKCSTSSSLSNFSSQGIGRARDGEKTLKVVYPMDAPTESLNIPDKVWLV